MPSNIRLSDFLKWFRKHGVEVNKCGGKGSHLMLVRFHNGQFHRYPIPTVGGREVKHRYLAAARKALKLTLNDGVPDDDFK